jgi:Integrase zinc binding domain/Chromo (CHRromatin Organisation MOdifier) domain
MHPVGNTELLMRLDWGSRGMDGTPNAQLVIPKSLRDQLLNTFHGTAWAGHQGCSKVLAALRREVWWPSWISDTVYWVTRCIPCQARKRDGKLNHWPMVWRDRPSAPFDTIAIDHFGPLPTSSGGHTHILAVQCMNSRWVELYPVKPEQFDAFGTAEILVDQFCTQHGPPRQLLSDRGSSFMSALSRAFYQQMGIRKLSTTAYHPQTNGMIERFMKHLAQNLAMVVDWTHADWHSWLRYVAYTYNTQVHSTLGVSPFLLATGREPRIALHLLLGRHRTGSSAQMDDRIHNLLERQRLAQDWATHRYDARKGKVLAKNESLASALGLRHPYVVGGKAFVYVPPRTHSGATAATDATEAWRITWSRKLLNSWQGPFEVLAVGPATWQDKPVSPVNLVLRMGDKPVFMHILRCKPYRDPADGAPETLPTGFARYLLARQRRAIAIPDWLTDEQTTWESDRHSVEAVLGHRLVTQARGRQARLEYLVRWEGGVLVDSWEPEDNLDACEQILDEYWLQIGRTTGPVKGGDTNIVKARLKRAHKRLGLDGVHVVCGRGTYKLPSSVIALPACPPAHKLYSPDAVNIGILIVYLFDEGLSTEHLAWCQGEIVRGAALRGTPAFKVATKNARAGYFRVAFQDGAVAELRLSAELYSTVPTAPRSSWFLFGKADQVRKLSTD